MNVMWGQNTARKNWYATILHYNVVGTLRGKLMRNACDSEEMRRAGNGHGGHERVHGNDKLEEDSEPNFLT